MKHAAQLIATLALLAFQNPTAADVIQVSGTQTAHASLSYWGGGQALEHVETSFPATGSVSAATEPPLSTNSVDYSFYGTASQAFFDWRFALERAPYDGGYSASIGHLEFVVTEDTPYSVAGEYFHHGGDYEHEVQLVVFLRDATAAEDIFVTALWINTMPEAYLAVGQTENVAITADPVGSPMGILLAGRHYSFDFRYSTLSEDGSSSTGSADLRLVLGVPEPSAMLLAAIGFVAIIASRRFRHAPRPTGISGILE